MSKCNPQANAILEQAHGTIGKMICTFELDNIDVDRNDPFAELVSAAGFAILLCTTLCLGPHPDS